MMTRHDEEISILAAVEQRLVNLTDFIRVAADRLGESDPLRDQLEAILGPLDDAVDSTRSTKEMLLRHRPFSAGHPAA